MENNVVYHYASGAFALSERAKASIKFFADKFPDRFYNVGIAELFLYSNCESAFQQWQVI